MKVTLREHLKTIDQNGQVCEAQIDSLVKRMKKKFKDCGFVKASKRDDLIRRYIDMIFETQDYRCTHWIPVNKDELNGVWNRPFAGYVGWKTKEVLYEIDHVHPVNAGGRDSLRNFQFLSANANQFVKCSLTYRDLYRRVDLSDSLKSRISDVMTRRSQLFASSKWKDFMSDVEDAETQ